MNTCQRCGIAISQKPRGRRRKYCADCLKIRTAESLRQYKRRQRELAISLIPVQCCRDWVMSAPRNGYVCPQRRQWESFIKYRHKVDWRRSDLPEFARLLEVFCDGDIDERNFSIVTASLISPFSWHDIVRVIVWASV